MRLSKKWHDMDNYVCVSILYIDNSISHIKLPISENQIYLWFKDLNNDLISTHEVEIRNHYKGSDTQSVLVYLKLDQDFWDFVPKSWFD